MTRSFSKIPVEVRSLPKKSEDARSPCPSLWTCINASLLPVLLTSNIRVREEGIAIYSFHTWLSFLTWVWVNIFLEIVSIKTATTHIFQSGMRNWPASVSQLEIEVFNSEAWVLRRESWQIYNRINDFNFWRRFPRNLQYHVAVWVDSSFKPGFHMIGDFTFLLTIPDFADILYNHQRSVPNFREMPCLFVIGGLEPRNSGDW